MSPVTKVSTGKPAPWPPLRNRNMTLGPLLGPLGPRARVTESQGQGKAQERGGGRRRTEEHESCPGPWRKGGRREEGGGR